MKSLIKISFLIFLCSLSFQLKVKKSETMMEFYNNLFNKNYALNANGLESNTEISHLKTKNRNHSNNKENSESSNLFESRYSDEKKEEGDAGAGAAPDQGAPLYTGYHKISSPLFTSETLFPPIRVINSSGGSSYLKIKTDKKFFRINENPLPADSEQDERDFYFTLTKTHLYYSVDNKDINVLQSFDFESYNKIELLPIEWQIDTTYIVGFSLTQQMTKFTFNIWSKKKEENQKLMCLIGTILKKEIPSCINDPSIEKGTPVVATVITEVIEDATILVPLPSKQCNEAWNYVNHGEDWDCLCKDGKTQSPIDLPDPHQAILSPVTPLFQFDEIPAKSTVTTVDGEIKANDYIKMKYNHGALRILHPNLGKIVTLNGAVYIAEEITVHTPSEHTIQGKRYDMEIQITFYGQSKGDIAKQVMLSFIFERTPGYYNKFIDDLDFYTLPNKNFIEKDIVNSLFIPKILYSVNGDSLDDLPVMKPFSFYTYDGSLTMPPCSEDTIHYVASKPIPIGSVVLDLAREALKMPDMEQKNEITGEKSVLHDVTIPENYRNLQDSNGRSVFFFDHKKYCGGTIDNIIRKPKEKGHFEKLKKKVSEYIFVPGGEPSHIPGSFVVSEKEAKNLPEPINVGA